MKNLIIKKYFLNQKIAYQLSVIFILLLCFLALFSNIITPFDPNAINLTQRFENINAIHWLGTDQLGRDILSRLITGVRLSMSSVLITLSLIVMIGISLGTCSAMIGGRVDKILMRITELFLTFPTIILSLFLIAVLGTGLLNVIIAITVSHWPWYARITRSIILTIKTREFVLSSVTVGSSQFKIFKNHFLPILLPQILVLMTMDIGHIMLHISGLSFLGLGVTPPTAEWGIMISDAKEFIWSRPFLIFWPGLVLFLTVLSFNIIGDRLRDITDPIIHTEH